MGRGGLARALRAALPPEVNRTMRSLSLLDSRARDVLDQVSRCTSKYGETVVLQD